MLTPRGKPPPENDLRGYHIILDRQVFGYGILAREVVSWGNRLILLGERDLSVGLYAAMCIPFRCKSQAGLFGRDMGAS